MYVTLSKRVFLLSVLAFVLAAPAAVAGQAASASRPAVTAPANDPIPPDDFTVRGTKQMAGTVSMEGQTYDYDTFNFTVVNGRKSKEGYPVYAMECHFKGDRRCVGESGQALGTIAEVAKEMTTVSNRDVLRPDWYCDRICVNSQNVIVGSVSPAMQAWLKRHPKK